MLNIFKDLKSFLEMRNDYFFNYVEYRKDNRVYVIMFTYQVIEK